MATLKKREEVRSRVRSVSAGPTRRSIPSKEALVGLRSRSRRSLRQLEKTAKGDGNSRPRREGGPAAVSRRRTCRDHRSRCFSTQVKIDLFLTVTNEDRPVRERSDRPGETRSRPLRCEMRNGTFTIVLRMENVRFPPNVRRTTCGLVVAKLPPFLVSPWAGELDGEGLGARVFLQLFQRGIRLKLQDRLPVCV